MSNSAIRVQRLGKQYRIGRHERYRALRDVLTDTLLAPFHRAAAVFRRSPSTAANRAETIWALRDVSFEIEQGEVVGVIGRNGAGKSTLLKILSRITEPTEGQASVFGRVGSLLEVGTGFHPELSGRENIYLNGAILGMHRREIARKFDEIVAFAEVDQFIDTPVKHYSTGMYLRLAFAVAAHLEPEILLVDEVLAVGDAAFQNKCLGKMGDVAKEGRTVLFVSHNMGAIVQLCPKSVLLSSGQVESIDRSDRIVARYLSENASAPADVHLDAHANLHSPAVITRFWIAGSDSSPMSVAEVTKPFSIGLRMLVRENITNVDISIRFRNVLGQALFTTNLSDASSGLRNFTPGEHAFLVHIPSHFLAPDTYSLIVAIHRPDNELFDLHDSGLNFQVVESGSSMWRYHGQAYGNILVELPWESIS
jgi:lipopolysaccharide transport system ATP-binding protein